MKYSVLVSVMILLSACSMMPNQKKQHSNSIRIIKEEPVKYTSSPKYNTKIEQVAYNSSIIRPEVDPNYGKRKTPKKHQAYTNKSTNNVTKKVTHKVTSKVQKRTNQTKNKVLRTVDHAIDHSIDSLFE